MAPKWRDGKKMASKWRDSGDKTRKMARKPRQYSSGSKTVVISRPASVIRHDTAQSLTAPQQAQARANIDAASGAQGAKADTALQAARIGHGVNSILVDASADNAVANGTALLAAYTAAKALTPNGAALSATNRATVLIAPGRYDLNGSMLTLDTQYVDLAGLSSDRTHTLITSATAGQNSGTVVQTASDVRLANLTLQNTCGSPRCSSAWPWASCPWWRWLGRCGGGER
jgi:hypothetical protein